MSEVVTSPRREALPAVSVSVVLPCLNEAESVGPCVEEALRSLRELTGTGEVVVVDNGSSDGSAERAIEAGARVIHESRPGYGSALRAGFATARGDVVVMADADSTYPLDRIPDLVRPVVDGEADMVLGARLGDANSETMPFLHRYVGTPVITWLTARACGRRVVSDSQSGFRAFRRDKIAALGLRGSGMELATEMLIRSARSGLRIQEIDTGYRPRIGESKLDTWSDGWRHLMLVLMLAPDLLLIGPGLALSIIGVVMVGLSFISPEGIEVGSLQWQPVFFSGIALILGVQAMLAGVVLAHESSVTSSGIERRFGFVGHPRFRRRTFAVGAAMAVIGLGINIAMLVLWVGGEEFGANHGLGLASLAQSLIVVGGTLVTFSIVAHFRLRQSL
jgi:glycosyltransferase involved in cell wall biosynthesis